MIKKRVEVKREEENEANRKESYRTFGLERMICDIVHKVDEKSVKKLTGKFPDMFDILK